jgi:integrase
MITLPRYLLAVSREGGTHYRYNPPAEATEAGVVQRVMCGTDYEYAVDYANLQNRLLDQWRSAIRYSKNLSDKSKLDDLVKSYLNSIGYKALSEKSKHDYAYYLKQWYGSSTWSQKLLNTRLGDLSTPICQRIYDMHAENSVSLANHSLAVYRLLFSFAIRNGFTKHNPFTEIDKRQDKPRRVVWTKPQIKKFMDTAFTKYEWRNVGLLVYMAYSWGQRLGDMRMLTWDNYNADTGVMKLEQSKRRAMVELPTGGGLREMLAQQKSDMGWQKYIVPSTKGDGSGGFKTYTLLQLAAVGATIMKAAGLPEHLRLMDMRRTAVTEMIEAGVPLTNIMSVTGHATTHSLTPYIKNTLKSASLAQGMRDML